MNGKDYEISNTKIKEDFRVEFTPLDKIIHETRISLEKFDLHFE